MPPLANVASVARIDLAFTYGADANVRCRHFAHFSGTANAASMTALAGAASTAWFGHFAGLMPATVTLNEVIATDLTSATGAVGTSSGTWAGTRAGASLTADTCALLALKINRRYRGGHPRLYLPLGTVGDLQSPQQWLGTFAAAVNTAWGQYFNGLIGASGGPGVDNSVAVSWFHGGTWVPTPSGGYVFKPTPRATPLVDTAVAYACSLRPGSQRRRML